MLEIFSIRRRFRAREHWSFSFLKYGSWKKPRFEAVLSLGAKRRACDVAVEDLLDFIALEEWSSQHGASSPKRGYFFSCEDKKGRRLSIHEESVNDVWWYDTITITISAPGKDDFVMSFDDNDFDHKRRSPLTRNEPYEKDENPLYMGFCGSAGRKKMVRLVKPEMSKRAKQGMLPSCADQLASREVGKGKAALSRESGYHVPSGKDA